MRRIILVVHSMNDRSVCISGEVVVILRVVAVDHGLRKAKKEELQMMNKFTGEFIKSLVLDRLNQSQRNSGRSKSFRPTGRIRTDSFTFEDGYKKGTMDARMSQSDVLSWLTDVNAEGLASEIDGFFEETDDDIPY